MKYTDAQLWELRKKYNPFENCEFENKMLRVLLLNNYQIDDVVFLPSIQKNLQRDYYWDLRRKQSFIYSLFIGKPLTPMGFIHKNNDTNTETSVLECIDGKQRLNALRSFLNNEFSFELEGKLLYAADFDKSTISTFFLQVKVPTFWINEYSNGIVSDYAKLLFFKWLNPDIEQQDQNRLNQIENELIKC